MKELEMEIEAVKNLIKLLKRCMVISLLERRKDETKRVKADLKVCKLELQKLLLKREEIRNSLLDAAEQIEMG
ncbi:MAG TPA: hypothetical protein VLG50_03220 [Candidatus Saccharimonadales bacterium]|nr:hypothetical protein [Candidatus Saccharimonadales bacterium]